MQRLAFYKNTYLYKEPQTHNEWEKVGNRKPIDSSIVSIKENVQHCGRIL